MKITNDDQLSRGGLINVLLSFWDFLYQDLIVNQEKKSFILYEFLYFGRLDLKIRPEKVKITDAWIFFCSDKRF